MNVNLIEVLVLLGVFQIKHFLADFPMQNEYMLGKFKPGWDFLKPLSAHCFVHSAITFLIAMWYETYKFESGSESGFVSSILFTPILFGLFDFAMHFIMDRIKAGPKYLGRFKPDNKYFWWSLGLDQGWHHLTHYTIITMLLIF